MEEILVENAITFSNGQVMKYMLEEGLESPSTMFYMFAGLGLIRLNRPDVRANSKEPMPNIDLNGIQRMVVFAASEVTRLQMTRTSALKNPEHLAVREGLREIKTYAQERMKGQEVSLDELEDIL